MVDVNRMTHKMQEALQSAGGIATRRSHQGIDVEHLLQARLEQPDGLAPNLLEAAGVAPRDAGPRGDDLERERGALVHPIARAHAHRPQGVRARRAGADHVAEHGLDHAPPVDPRVTLAPLPSENVETGRDVELGIVQVAGGKNTRLAYLGFHISS